jgi:Homeodomain-like domain
MPWTETAPIKERMRFVTDGERELYSMVELCARYGVSRKTGYKWVARYEREGPDGLRARSRAPHYCPHRIAADVAAAICAGRRQHPSWGPEKILHWLKRRHPALEMPAPSTAGDLLARRGLVKKRRRRRHYAHPGVVPPTTHRPNDLWTADFKGHFRTRDGLYCYPLTVADQHTRYLLGCQGLLSTKGQGVRPIFDRLFREYGLPAPFAPTMACRSPPPASTASRRSTCGGCGWASSISGSCPLVPSKTAPTNGCIEPSRRRPPGHPRATCPPRNAPSTGSASSTTRNARINFSGPDARVAVPAVAPSVHGGRPTHRVPGPLHSQAGDERRDDPIQETPALHRELAQATGPRPRGSR